MPDVAIIVIGTEMTAGSRVDTNSGLIARTFAAGGLRCRQTVVVEDDIGRIAAAVRQGLAGNDAVVVSGGLGPTHDDLTRQAIAQALGLTMHGGGLYPELEGASAIAGPPRGAPGVFWSGDGKALAALPGVPWELAAMLPEAERLITDSLGAPALPVKRRTILIAGMGESDVAEMLSDAIDSRGIEVTILAGSGQVSLDLSCWDADGAAKLRALADDLVERLGRHVFATEPDATLPLVVGGLLNSHGLTLAVAESCTGGLLASEIVSVPGSSAYFRGGVVAYADSVKAGILSVSEDTLRKHGAVDPAVAEEMAIGASRALGSDVGISVTGIAGPEGGSLEKPVGLVYIGSYLAGQTAVSEHRFRGDRGTIRATAVTMALDHLRLRLSPAVRRS